MTYTFNDIARYAEGDMSPEEKQAFEQAIAADAELQKQYAAYLEVSTSLQQQFSKDEKREQLQQTLGQLRTEFFNTTGASDNTNKEIATPPSKVLSINRYLRIAVAAAAVLVIGLFIWQPWQAPLYERYSETTMTSQTERGSHTDSVLYEATTAFNNKEYITAAVLLAEINKSEPDNSFAAFYFGVSLMKTDKITQARTVFSQVFQGESAYKYEAAFYQALTYLHEKDKDIPSAKAWLEKIPADASNYNKAQELLKKL